MAASTIQHRVLLVVIAIIFALPLSLAIKTADTCFDGKYWMDPTLAVPHHRASCPQGYRLAVLPNIAEHIKAARLLYSCKGGKAMGWIGASTSDDGVVAALGPLALVAPQEIGLTAGRNAVGGVVRARNAVLCSLCERVL